MAFASRSSVFAFVEEVVEGTPVDPAPEDFTVVREGASLTGAVNTVDSDELRNSIGASKSFVTSQAPTGSIPKYFKPSGLEGVPPDYSILIESCIGGLAVATVEVLTAAGSTPGDESTRGVLHVAAGDELNYQKGQGLLIKDGATGYAVRNVFDGITPGNLPLSFNLETAPGAGVGLGKAVLYYPKDVGQPTYTAHMYQASNAASGLHQAIAGCRTTSISAEFTANELAAITFEIGGLSYYVDPIRLGATSKYIDFTDSTGPVSAQLEEKLYATPIDLAKELASKMTAASAASAGDAISVAWLAGEGKFRIRSNGTVFSIQWLTGPNTANSAAAALGFNLTDDTGVLEYKSDLEQLYAPLVSPDYDDQGPQVVRNNMLLFGTFSDFICVGGQALTVSIATPKTDIANWCAENGLDESVILERTVTVSGTLKFQKHEVQRFYNLINNIESQLSFVHGERVAGNWVPGKVVNLYMPTVSMTSNTVADQDGYIVEQFEATAFVGDDLDDVYINFL